MKIIKKTWAFQSILYFTIFGMMYYYIIFCLSKQFSTISLHSISLFFHEAKFVFLFLILTRLLQSRLRLYQVLVTVYIVAFQAWIFFRHASSDKYFIISFFVASSISFLFILILSQELEDPIYNSHFDKRDLDENGQFIRVPCVLALRDDRKLNAVITNWSKDSMFIKLERPEKIKGHLVVNIKFNNHLVASLAQIFTRYNGGQGYGLCLSSLKGNDKNMLSWNDFHSRITDLGL